MSKTFAIGDIHGGYRSLIQCLKRSRFDYETDTLISLGDVSDGWSETPQVVEELLKIKNLIPIRGNHDAWTQEYLEIGEITDTHYNQGGRATIDAYTNMRLHHDFNEDNHLNFFLNQRNFYLDDQSRLFLHAGYQSEEGVGKDSRESNYYWDRSLWHKAMSAGKQKLNKTSMYKEVFIGHTTTMMWNIVYPMNKSNVWNLDTGGGFGGRLTIMDIDSKRFWQSDFVKDLYPNEKGR
jgi:serine/threonine protein phosphatase 1